MFKTIQETALASQRPHALRVRAIPRPIVKAFVVAAFAVAVTLLALMSIFA